jgi:hypothetical protein
LHETYLTDKFALCSLITAHFFQVTTPGTSFAVGITLKHFTAKVLMLSKLQYYISMLHGIRTKGSEYILVDSDGCNNDVAFLVTSEIV